MPEEIKLGVLLRLSISEFKCLFFSVQRKLKLRYRRKLHPGAENIVYEVEKVLGL